MNLDPIYWAWESALEPELCQLIMDLGNEMKPLEAEAGGDVQHDLRDSHVSWFDNDHWLAGLCNHFIRTANRQAWKFKIDECQGIQFTRYALNQFYAPHMDTFELADNMRKLSVCIQLNKRDEYEGGDFVFVDGDQELSPPEFREQGSVLVFPSFLLHAVKPVTSGTRHSVVSWCVGPQFK